MANLPPVPVLAPSLQPKSDRLEIANNAPGEPEEKPVARIVEVSLGGAITHGGKPLANELAERARRMPGQVVQGLGLAGTVATNLKSRCEYCANWDREAGQKYIGIAIEEAKLGKAPSDVFKIVNNARGLEQMGYCKAISAAMGKLPPEGAWITPSFGGCPERGQIITPSGEDVADLNLYKQRDRFSDHRGQTAYDLVLKSAQGKK